MHTQHVSSVNIQRTHNSLSALATVHSGGTQGLMFVMCSAQLHTQAGYSSCEQLEQLAQDIAIVATPGCSAACGQMGLT